MTNRDLRTDEKGAFKRKCAYCKEPFRTNNPRAKYCSEAHRKSARNQRYYGKYKSQVIAKVLERRKAK